MATLRQNLTHESTVELDSIGDIILPQNRDVSYRVNEIVNPEWKKMRRILNGNPIKQYQELTFVCFKTRQQDITSMILFSLYVTC